MTTPHKVADVLERAAELVAIPGAWTRGMLARDRDGRGVPPNDPRACCWCLAGALHKVSPNDHYGPYLKLAARAANAVEAAYWNDRPERTQAEVVSALRQAATLARGEG